MTSKQKLIAISLVCITAIVIAMIAHSAVSRHSRTKYNPTPWKKSR